MRPSQVGVLARDCAASHGLWRHVLGLVPAFGAEDEPCSVDRADRPIRVLHVPGPGGNLIEIVQSIPMEET